MLQPNQSTETKPEWSENQKSNETLDWDVGEVLNRGVGMKSEAMKVVVVVCVALKWWRAGQRCLPAKEGSDLYDCEIMEEV